MHTPGAIRAAIRIKTETHTSASIADLIDRETGVRELLEALKYAEELTKVARQYFPKSIKNAHKFQLENTCAIIGKAIHKTEGGSHEKQSNQFNSDVK